VTVREPTARCDPSGASASRRGSAIWVWGSKGKGFALPLASDQEADERSDVGRMVCLPVLEPARFSAVEFAVAS
jgi:hypothetical protein